MAGRICIHGHFYQPPRENPWLEEIETQDSAYPFHDWNRRITAECYAPNVSARIMEAGNILNIVNNFEKISFDFGPTLLSWLEKNNPEVYTAILEADRKSCDYFSGHGSAIAQCYNHIIMPLATPRDKKTQIVWGIEDFKNRFKRNPEGMWLPEMAVDIETLEIMADCGISFTILTPGQAFRTRRIGSDTWNEVTANSLNVNIPYLCVLPSGQRISIFFGDESIGYEASFGNLLDNGEAFAGRLLNSNADGADSDIVCVATDGEIYGHHKSFGDMALAYCIYKIEKNDTVRLTVFGEYLQKHPPEYEVEIRQNSSWSCKHGIDRWQSDCGCSLGRNEKWHQKWRAHLRGAVSWLCENLAHIFEAESNGLISDPWEARDDYIRLILNRSDDSLHSFQNRHSLTTQGKSAMPRMLKLLEMQRHALLMQTSCGWHGDEISGIETVQVMSYAARAMQLAQEITGMSLEEVFLELLARAPSNISGFESGKQVYESFVKTSVVDLFRVGAHYAVSSLFKDYEEETKLYSFTVKRLEALKEISGRLKLGVGRLQIQCRITYDQAILSYAVFHFGDHNFTGGIRKLVSKDEFIMMRAEFLETFKSGEIAEVISLIGRHFNERRFTLWHLFRDEQRDILNTVLKTGLEDIHSEFARIYEDNVPVIKVMHDMHIPLPKTLHAVMEYYLGQQLQNAFSAKSIDMKLLHKIVEELRRRELIIDRQTIGFIVEQRINRNAESFSINHGDPAIMEDLLNLFEAADMLNVKIHTWRLQNVFYAIFRKYYIIYDERSRQGEKHAAIWLERFEKLGKRLEIQVIQR